MISLLLYLNFDTMIFILKFIDLIKELNEFSRIIKLYNIPTTLYYS